MTDRTQSGVIISAAPSDVMAVIADFPAYPEWAKEFRSVEVLETGPNGRARDVRFEIDAGIINDSYTLRYTWDGDDAVSWELVDGTLLTELTGSYALAPHHEGGAPATAVTYELAVGLSVPMIGMLKRKAEKVIIDRALSGLKKRVEGASA
jgi:ribosome-associated toxin RatA of RatAB toxin-antitoxin module